MGRAYPEVQLVTMTLYGIKACPFSIVDEHGNSAVINAIDNTWTERMARPLAVEFGAISTGMGYPMTGAQVREAAVFGTLSWAERIGAAIREAREEKADPIAALLEATGGIELFRGKIVDVERAGSSAAGRSANGVLEGLDEFAGER